MLKPSASNSSFAFSLIVNRRETRKSTYLIEGEWKKLFGNNANRSDPFEPFTTPAGLAPNTEDVAKELVVGVYRNPENMLPIGAIVQPFRIALPASFRLLKFVL